MSEQTGSEQALATAPDATAIAAGSVPGATLFAKTFSSNGGFPSGRQLGLVMLGAVVLAALIVAIMWADRATYRVVYPGLSDRDAAAVMGVLQGAAIPVRIDPSSGNVEVPSDRVHEARFKLAADGLPRGTGSGYEFLQDNTPMGSNQFMDVARYRHALETELARSISSLSAIDSTRVHLAMERRSAFVRKQTPPTASVILRLYSGRSLDEGQIAAIAHLVSTAVPGMSTDGVSIIDQLGRLLSASGKPGGSKLSLDQLEYAREIEAQYVRRIEQILSPLVGVGSVRAEASADVDFTVVERTEERYDENEKPQIRSEQVTRNGDPAADPAAGVAGALTNEPPVAPTEGAGAAVPAGQSPAETRWVRNFELDKSISHVQVPVGQIKRLTVAVVVDHSSVTAADGTVTREPLPEEQMQRITQLVKDAVGFNQERGDSVNVVNSAFQSEAVEVIPLWEQPWVISWGRLGAMTLVALLVLFLVVRPLLKALIASLAPKESDTEEGRQHAGGKDALRADSGGGVALAGIPHGGATELLGDLEETPDYHADIRLAQRVAANDPRRAAQVVKRWLENAG